MPEGVLQLLFHLHPVHPELGIHHLDSALDHFRAVVRECCDSKFGRPGNPGARGDALLRFNEIYDVCSSKALGSYGSRKWHQLPLVSNGKDQGLGKLHWIMCMIG